MPPPYTRAIALLTLLITAVALASDARGQCINPNGSFSAGMADWATEYGDPEVDSKDGRSYCLKVDESAVKQFIAVPGGGTYTFSFDVYGDNDNGNGKKPKVTVKAFETVDGSWAQISEEVLYEERTAQRWSREEIEFTVPAETEYLMYWLECKKEKAYFDEVCVAPTENTLSSGCGASDPSFELGLGGWYTPEAGVTHRTEGSIKYARVERTWLASKATAAVPSEQYTLEYRARRVPGTDAIAPWISLKYFTKVGGESVLIREEPLDRGVLSESWATYSTTAVTPPNVSNVMIVFSGGDVSTDVDWVCLRPTATLLKECVSDAGERANWSGHKAIKSHAGREDAVEIEKGTARHRFPATAGKVFRFDYQVYGADDDDKPTTFAVDWFDVDGVRLSTSTLQTQSFPKAWRDAIVQATAPAGAVEGEFQIRQPEKKVYGHGLCVSEIGLPDQASTISGRVFSDLDSDARLDDDEPYLGGTQLALYRDNGDGLADPDRDELVETRLSTNLSENYVFNGLPRGDYYVLAYLLPTKYISQYRAGGVPGARQSHFRSHTYRGQTTGITDVFTLDGSDFKRNVHLGQRPSSRAAITGYAWSDRNRNGRRDEPKATSGINGIRVQAFDAATDQLIKTTVTQDDPAGNPGYYLFNFVDPRRVYVRIDVPGGASLSDENEAYLDMRFRHGDGRTADIDLTADVTISNTSAAYYLSESEVCDNGIDDDGDGRIDDADSDCTTCVRQEEVLCGEPYRHYIPPVWQLDDPENWQYTGPAYLIITTDADATDVTASTPDGSISFSGTAGRTRELRIPLREDAPDPDAMLNDAPNTVRSDRGLIVESEQPVNVVYFVDGFYNKAIVTMKGEQALGNRFFAGSQTAQRKCQAGGRPVFPEPNGVLREAHFVSVMATEDDTRVTFDWRADSTTYFGLSGGTHAVTLDRGQTYLLRDDYQNQTVSGTRITSDKAITVISGSQHTNVCDQGGRDAGIDQLVPECYVGTEYVAVKHAGHNNQHYVVVVPTQDGTEIRLDGALVATRDAMAYAQIDIDGDEGDPRLISTSAPAYVYHVSGISGTNNEVGMALAASFGDCRGNRYLTFAGGAESGDVRRSLNVIVPASVAPSLQLNGAPALSLTSAIARNVPGRTDFLSIVVPGGDIGEVNTLEADGYFQAALLIGTDRESGTYGYLTSFAQGIDVREPATGRPASRYELNTVCGGTTVEHTLAASSCGARVRIVDHANNTNLGTITLTGDLSFRYEADAAAYGEDNLTLRLRDDNGLETSICIRTFVCGSSVPISGLPDGLALSCGQAIPTGNPLVSSEECPVALPIPFTDERVAGDCPGEYAIVRTWSKANACGTVISASRSFYFHDDTAPTIAGVPADTSVCSTGSLPPASPTVADACGGSATLAVDTARTDYPNTSRYALTRTWTATDRCGNTATASQRVTFLEVPRLRNPILAAGTTCGLDDGAITIDFEDDGNRTGIQFSVNGSWRAALPTAARTVTYAGLAAGTYVVRARWGNLDCPVDLGSVTVPEGPVPSTNTISGPQAGCTPFDPNPVTGSDAGAGVSYRWEYRRDGGAWRANATTTRDWAPGPQTTSMDVRRGVRYGDCPWSYSPPIRVEVIDPLTAPGGIGDDEEECVGYDPRDIRSSEAPSGGAGGTVVYRWQRRAGTSGAFANVPNSNSASYDPPAITGTTQYRRGARRVADANTGCAWIWTPVVTKRVTDPVTDAGAIAGDQDRCGGYDPTAIASSRPASGGDENAIEYRWQARVGGGGWTWVPAAGGSAATYDPSAITATTFYRRGSRRDGAQCAWAFTAEVAKRVSSNVADGGEIAGDQTSCEGFDPSAITSASPASGGSGAGVVYQWQRRAPGQSWANISGATELGYDPNPIAETTEYRRLARRSTGGCGWESAGVVTKTVIAPLTDVGRVAGDQSGCGGFDPAPLTSASAAAGGAGAPVEYRWQRRAESGAWANVPDSDRPGFDPPAVTATTYYRRLARRGACAFSFAGGNVVALRVDPVPAVALGSDQAVCAEDSRALTAAVTGGTAPFTYIWTGGGTGASETVAPTVDTVYAVTVSDANGCTAVDEVRVTVDDLPEATAAGTDPTACAATDGSIRVTFPDHPTRTHLSVSVRGDRDYVKVADDAGAYTFNGLGAGSYDLSVRWDDGTCPVSLPAVTLSDPSAPVADFDMSGADDCAGSVETFTTVAVLGAAYAWDFGPDATPRTATGQSVTASFGTTRGAEDIPVTLTVTRAGCVSSVTKTVRRRASPAAQVALVEPTDPTTCGGRDGRLDLTAPNPSGSCLEFSVDGVNWSTDRSIGGLAAGTYTLRIRYCNDECEEVVGNYALVAPPTPNVSVGDALDLCLGSAATLRATAAGGSPPYRYAWDNGGGTGGEVSVTPRAETTYAVVVTDAAGCTAGASQRVRVTSAPSLDLVIDDLTGGAPIALTDGGRYHLSQLPADWNISALAEASTGRVIFDLTGVDTDTKVVAAGDPLVYHTAGQGLGLAAGGYRLRTRALAVDRADAQVCAEATVAFYLEDYEICDNGVDDDGDGATDCDDDACPKPAAVQRVNR